MTTVVLIPFKGRETGKSRLRAKLSDDTRAHLAQKMFEHVLTVVVEARGAGDCVRLLSTSPSAREFAARLGVETIADPASGGLNESISHAVSRLAHFRNVTVISADLPQLTCDDVDALIPRRAGECVIAPDRNLVGTNALSVPANADIKFGFGDRSFEKHTSQFRNTGRPFSVLARVDLMNDVDYPIEAERFLERITTRERSLYPPVVEF